MHFVDSFRVHWQCGFMMNSHPCDWGSSPGNHTLMRYALNNINIKFISDESSADFGIIFM